MWRRGYVWNFSRFAGHRGTNVELGLPHGCKVYVGDRTAAGERSKDELCGPVVTSHCTLALPPRAAEIQKLLTQENRVKLPLYQAGFFGIKPE